MLETVTVIPPADTASIVPGSEVEATPNCCQPTESFDPKSAELDIPTIAGLAGRQIAAAKMAVRTKVAVILKVYGVITHPCKTRITELVLYSLISDTIVSELVVFCLVFLFVF